MAFPKAVTIQWSANPPGDNVSAYAVSVNGASLGTTTSTQMPYNVPSSGTYVASVHATNTFGDGLDGQATLVAAIPQQVTNVTFVVP